MEGDLSPHFSLVPPVPETRQQTKEGTTSGRARHPKGGRGVGEISSEQTVPKRKGRKAGYGWLEATGYRGLRGSQGPQSEAQKRRTGGGPVCPDRPSEVVCSDMTLYTSSWPSSERLELGNFWIPSVAQGNHHRHTAQCRALL